MKFVSENTAREAAANGVLVAKCEPTRETKGAWWEVYRYNGKLIACVCDSAWGVSCGEEITEQQLASGQYGDPVASHPGQEKER